MPYLGFKSLSLGVRDIKRGRTRQGGAEQATNGPIAYQWSANTLADLKQATELAQKALALDDTDSSALALLGDSDWMQGRYDQAVADGERAVAINPNYAIGFFGSSRCAKRIRE